MRDVIGSLSERIRSRKVIGGAALFAASTTLLWLGYLDGGQWVALNTAVYGVFATASAWEKSKAIDKKKTQQT